MTTTTQHSSPTRSHKGGLMSSIRAFFHLEHEKYMIPSRCIRCGREVDQDNLVCAICWSQAIEIKVQPLQHSLLELDRLIEQNSTFIITDDTSLAEFQRLVIKKWHDEHFR